MGKLIAGVDDAGRGPIIGPLVVAGVLLGEDRDRELLAMGVKDSKLLTPEVRTQLAPKIRALATKVSAVEVQPKEIDEVVLHGGKLRKLNFLEAQLMAQVITELSPEEVYVDASDVNEQRYGETIREFLPAALRKIKVVSEHHADRTYPVVSAASIIAKVRRDEAVEALRRQYGNFGSGYITDARTLNFLREWRRTHDEYPPIVRLSWKTIKEIEREFGQSILGA
ncbi:MAG: ribonuclease HII [Candidatus Bathyarchaeia archaeon]|jgi:ribonuclease HII